MKAVNLHASRRARADIDLGALRHNFSIVRDCQPHSHILAVVKANAYGHGIKPVAAALRAVMRDDDAYAVASIAEAMELRELQPDAAIVVFQGANDEEELREALKGRFGLVVHSPHQLALLQQADLAPRSLHIWLKLETGMNRLGMAEEDFAAAWRALDRMPAVAGIVLMSHLAKADDLHNDSVHRQLARFQQVVAAHRGVMDKPVTISLAASGGILAWPETHYDWLRPGIMLYGGSSLLEENGPDRGLKPVMTLRSRLIAIKTVEAGESIGYGATYTCNETRRVGVVSIGYGDGYPRHAPNGTPILVSAADGRFVRTQLIGRVSMDMVTVDLTGIDTQTGAEVILWGEGLPADEIARRCGTISYELFCQITSRVPFIYHGA